MYLPLIHAPSIWNESHPQAQNCEIYWVGTENRRMKNRCGEHFVCRFDRWAVPASHPTGLSSLLNSSSRRSRMERSSAGAVLGTGCSSEPNTPIPSAVLTHTQNRDQSWQLVFWNFVLLFLKSKGSILKIVLCQRNERFKIYKNLWIFVRNLIFPHFKSILSGIFSTRKIICDHTHTWLHCTSSNKTCKILVFFRKLGFFGTKHNVFFWLFQKDMTLRFQKKY